MTQVKENAEQRTEHQPTIMETELDSITLLLGQMRAKVQRNSLLDHLTSVERSELQAALARVEGKMTELGEVIRSGADA
jgi:hypothetical protein